MGHYHVVDGGTGVAGGRCGGRYAVLGVPGVLGTFDVDVVVDFVVVVVVGGVVLRMSWWSHMCDVLWSVFGKLCSAVHRVLYSR